MKLGNNQATLPTVTLQPSPSAPTQPGGQDPAVASSAQVNLETRPIAPTQFRDRGRYQVLGEHGRGGLGRVTRAHDLELRRDVAIKELLSRDDIREARFVREAMITARLEHPGIVPVHEAGRWSDGTPFYAMKLVSGRPLRELLAERTTVEQRITLLHHVIAVADAIAYAHGRNIIHRDLKPANVVVGDFGETVVIDWGLAKDLSVSDDLPTANKYSISEAAPRSDRVQAQPHDRNLTMAGTVLGTPSYMAPEQERGENVDQRADVFAIGAMLWELCSLQRVPPGERRQRHRMLRRTGIDQDLATIIDKALSPDPAFRYPDAGALAADLKAFKLGARIAARTYSLFALLSHWTRRHRSLATSIIGLTAFAVIAAALYVDTTTSERDRADASEARAIQAQSATEVALNDLTLKHALLLLTTDPTAAIDILGTYRGTDITRASQVRAEALGRGVAVLRAVPHNKSTDWIAGLSDGRVITLSNDGTIRSTSKEGAMKTLARNVASTSASAYHPSSHRLAYVCNPSNVCLMDVSTGTPLPTPISLQGIQADRVAFSPNGSMLAVISKSEVLTVAELNAPPTATALLRRDVAGGIDVRFLNEGTVLADTVDRVDYITLNGESRSISIPSHSYWDTRDFDNRLVAATTYGEAFIFENFPPRLMTRKQLCNGPITGIRFIPRHSGVAYACRSGTVGIWEQESNSTSQWAHFNGYSEHIEVSADGDYIATAGGEGTIGLFDLHTKIVTLYKGHSFRVTILAAPTSEQPLVLSGDAQGAIRAWPLPLRVAKHVASVDARFHNAMFLGPGDMLIATTFLPTLATFSQTHGLKAVAPHISANVRLAANEHDQGFATYGFADAVELWASDTMTRKQVIATDHGSISQLNFITGSDDFVTAGRDGTIARWNNGKRAVIAQVDQAIDHFALIGVTGTIVFSTIDGSLRLLTTNGEQTKIRAPISRINTLSALPDKDLLLVGYANGDVLALRLSSMEENLILHASGAIQEVAPSTDGRLLAVTTNDGNVHIAAIPQAIHEASWVWTHASMHARSIAWGPTGILSVACTNGVVWLYSTRTRQWTFLVLGSTNLSTIALNKGGSVAAVLDTEGNLSLIDMISINQQFSNKRAH